MDFSPTIWEGIYRAARRNTMPNGSKSAGGRYKKSRKVSRKLTPFKRYNTKAMVARAKTKALTKLIKAVQLKDCETCYRTRKFDSITVNHNVIKGYELWIPADDFTNGMWPTQGNTDGNRKGDEILCQGIKLRGILSVPYDRRATVLKVFFVQYNSSQGDPAQFDQLFHNVIGSVMTDPIQKDRWPGIKLLGTYRVKARDLSPTGQRNTIIINRWIPMKKKVTFINDGSNIAANVREYGRILFMAYDAVGTLQTDTLIDNGQMTATLYYKDP